MNSAAQKVIGTLVGLAWLAIFATPVSSHCEIPCGIYDDEMRLRMIAENITTVEKSMKQVAELSKQASLTLLHKMLVYAMKAKQTTDLGNVEKLREFLSQFRAAYLGQEAHQHAR